MIFKEPTFGVVVTGSRLDGDEVSRDPMKLPTHLKMDSCEFCTELLSFPLSKMGEIYNGIIP